MTKAQRQNLKRKLDGLSDEEKTNKIKDLLLEEELREWRYLILSKYRNIQDMKNEELQLP